MATKKAQFTDLQIRVINYLSASGHEERHKLLSHLRTTTPILNPGMSDAHTIIGLKNILRANPTGACSAGVQRFYKAFPEVAPVQGRKFKLLVELHVEGYPDTGRDGRFSQEIVNNLEGLELNGAKVVGVRAGDVNEGAFFTKLGSFEKKKPTPRNGVLLACGCWHYGMVGQSSLGQVKNENMTGWNSNECYYGHGCQLIVKCNVDEPLPANDEPN